MIELLSGFVAGGVAGAILKDKVTGGSTQKKKMQNDIDSLCTENNKLASRNKELERQVEDLLSQMNKIRRNNKEINDDHDDLEDELVNTKREVKNLRSQNEELTRKIREYKMTCESQEAEISMLKTKLG